MLIRRLAQTTGMIGMCLSLLSPRRSAAQCTKDTDCKGDRICTQGACVDPPHHRSASPQAPATPTNASGSSVRRVRAPVAVGAATAAVRAGRLKLRDGSTIAIPEVILKTEATTQAGSSVFRDIAGGDKSSYRISYLPYDKDISQIEINILLNTTPLSQARLEAERTLRGTLGATNEQLCKMDVSVNVFRWVDETYAGRKLGLSFCNNAISLP